ncbi:MAG: type IV secretion system protein [Pseudomonadota bacterium]
MKRDAALQAYFAEAASWDADRAAVNERSVRTAWRVAIGACVLAVAAILALVMLMPLKRVDPFVIRVDNATGIVDVVPVFAGQASMPEVVTRYFLDHYLTVCERFNFSTAESDYEECSSFHAPARHQEWMTLWDRSNPNSPLNRYKDGSSIRVQVSSITFFKRGTGTEDLAQVRYVKAHRTGNGNEQRSYWIATIQYVYGAPSKDPLLRRWNPLGFKIVDVRTEAEATQPEPTNGAKSTAAATAAGSAP